MSTPVLPLPVLCVALSIKLFMIEKIRQKLEGNQIKVLAAVLGVSAFAAFLYFRPKPPKDSDKYPSPRVTPRRSSEASPRVSPKHSSDEEGKSGEEKALVTVINRLKKLLTGETPNFQAVKEIYGAQYELSREEFREAVVASRRARRKLIANLAEYQQEFARHEAEVLQTHSKHLNAILAHFRIDKGGWMQLTDGAAAESPKEWGALLVATDEQALESIRDRNKPKLKLPVLASIEKHRLKVLREKIGDFKLAFSRLGHSDLYNLVEQWGNDNVYLKFNVEEEDIIFRLQPYLGHSYSQRAQPMQTAVYSRGQLSAQEKEELAQYEEEVQKLMEELLYNDPHSQSEAENEHSS